MKAPIIHEISKLNRHALRSLLGLALICAVGCFRFDVAAPDTGKPLELPASFPAATFCMQIPATDTSVGNQFVLGIIPATRLYISGADALAKKTVTRWMARAGLRAIENCNLPQITVHIEQMRVSAYDLLLVRRLSAKITGTITTTHGTTAPLSHTRGMWRRFGFGPQVVSVLEETLEEALVPASAILKVPAA